MADHFMGEIKILGFNWPPNNWAACDGQMLPINQHQALFSILGTSYGGNGMTTFGLPDMQGRTIIQAGKPYSIGTSIGIDGTKGGEEVHFLTVNEMPSHNHHLLGYPSDGSRSSAKPNSSNPGPFVFADNGTNSPPPTNIYGINNAGSTFNSDTVSHTGGSPATPLSFTQPSIAVFFCIALEGNYPSRN